MSERKTVDFLGMISIIIKPLFITKEHFQRQFETVL